MIGLVDVFLAVTVLAPDFGGWDAAASPSRTKWHSPNVKTMKEMEKKREEIFLKFLLEPPPLSGNVDKPLDHFFNHAVGRGRASRDTGPDLPRRKPARSFKSLLSSDLSVPDLLA